jgi:DNA repair exonuclease SbcCD ATPase subunit
VAKYSDISITCNQCGKKFIFSEDEQEFYKTKGYSAPLHCKQCRSARQQPASACTRCGNRLVEGSPLYCAACYIDVHLEFEQKARELKSLVQEAESKLQAAEAEKNRLLAEASRQIAAAESQKDALASLLMQKEQSLLKKETISGLEQRLDSLIAKMQQVPENIDSRQISVHLADSLKEKMESLERNQNSLKELLLQLIENRDNFRHKDSSIVGTLKTLFRSDHRSPA